MDARRGRSSSFSFLRRRRRHQKEKSPTFLRFSRALSWPIFPLSTVRPSSLLVRLLQPKESKSRDRKGCRFGVYFCLSLCFFITIDSFLSFFVDLPFFFRRNRAAGENRQSSQLHSTHSKLQLSQNFNSTQDEILRRAVSHHGGRCWKQIGENFGPWRNENLDPKMRPNAVSAEGELAVSAIVSRERSLSRFRLPRRELQLSLSLISSPLSLPLITLSFSTTTKKHYQNKTKTQRPTSTTAPTCSASTAGRKF